MIVFACNTATAVAWEEVKEKLDIPVLGVILPGASAAIKATQTGKVGVLGTAMTIQSDIYREKIQALSPETQVDSLACPKFAPLVESNSHQSSLAKRLFMRHFDHLLGKWTPWSWDVPIIPTSPHHPECHGQGCQVD